MIDASPVKIQELLSRGVEEVVERESLEKKLRAGKQLRIKYGIDPTGPKVHLGRAVPLWKLRAFQELGHKIVLIVGDHTAQIGDPSDKLSKRPMLTKSQVRKNMQSYQQQMGKILDMKKVELHFNSQWLNKMKPLELERLADLFTVQQILGRRNFKERVEKGEEISLRELHYPLYQGYDSVAIRADVEVGGYDQLFNLLAGRDIQRAYGQPAQDILTTKMLSGLDGRKMSTTWGNVINIIDTADEIYGKIMSMHDDMMLNYFLLCTKLPFGEIEKIKKNLAAGANPRDIKMRLAREIVTLYHSASAVLQAEENFKRIFQKKELPAKMPVCKIAKTEINIVDLLVATKLATSKSDARRLVQQAGVAVDEKEVKDINAVIQIPVRGAVLQKGRRYFIKVILGGK